MLKILYLCSGTSMHLRTSILLLALIYFSGGLALASSRADSLQRAIEKSPDNIQKVELLTLLSHEMEYDAPSQALELSQRALQLSQKLKYKKGIAQSLNDIGVCYYLKGDLTQALKYYFESLKTKEELGDQRGIGVGYLNIGQIYHEQDQLKFAREYYHKALNKFINIHNEKEMAAAYNLIGTVFFSENAPDSALKYYHKSLEIRERIHDVFGLSEVYGNLAIFYKVKKDYKRALEYYNADIALSEKEGDTYNATISMNNTSLFYFEIGEKEKAIALAEKSAELSEQKGYLKNLKYALGNLATFYSETNNYKQAFKTLSIYLSVEDSLKNTKIAELINNYESKRKELEIKNLKSQGAIDSLKIARTEGEKIAIEKQKTTQTIAFSIGLIFLLLISGLIWVGYRNKQKANVVISQQKREVEMQKHLVEEKNKEIIDSINYAKRIQQSVITSENYLKQHLQEFFVLFKPKDIVAGDFYWALDTEEGFMLATGDCTGHGVPGAIMSVIGINFLNEITMEKKMTDPGKILNELRRNIIKAMNPEGTEEEGKDGMDICLYVLDKKNYRLTYAAANNPLWMIRNNTFTEHKPDKMPVGKFTGKDESFTTRVIDLIPGDVIYTLTDGYADQFGGPGGKKFKYKALQELILNISPRNMDEQKKILTENFNHWKGDLEQVDDVCIIGVRI